VTIGKGEQKDSLSAYVKKSVKQEIMEMGKPGEVIEKLWEEHKKLKSSPEEKSIKQPEIELSFQEKALLFARQHTKIILTFTIVVLITLLLIIASSNNRGNIDKASTKQQEKNKNVHLTQASEKPIIAEDKVSADKSDELASEDNIRKENVGDKEQIEELKPLLVIPFVKHIHTIGSCSGSLIFYDEYIEYKTAGKDYRRWKYDKLRGYEYTSSFLIIKTYERQDYDVIKIANRDFKFRLPNNADKKEIIALLENKIKR